MQPHSPKTEGELREETHQRIGMAVIGGLILFATAGFYDYFGRWYMTTSLLGVVGTLIFLIGLASPPNDKT